MTVDIRIAEQKDAGEWDAVVAGSPQGTIFHEWNFVKIVEKHTNSRLYPLIGVKGGAPVAIMPLFFQKNGPVRMVFSPPPHASLFYMGTALAGNEAQRQDQRENTYIEFQNAAEEFIQGTLKAGYVSISLPPSLPDTRPFIWQGYTVEPHFEYVIDLSPGYDRLFTMLDKKQRQNMNRATRRGITIEVGGKDEYEAILDLMEHRYAEQGKMVTSTRRYFRELYDVYRDSMNIFVAKADNEIITGTIDFHYRDIHYSWIGTPKPRKPVTPSPNDLLIGESVRFACEHGLKYYVTMGAAGDRRLHAYYGSKFNPILRVHSTVKKGTAFAGLLETGYKKIVKPVKEMVKRRNQGD